jgi:hypothetical protein
LPSAAQQERLEALLLVPEGMRYSHLDRLRRGPTRVSAPALIGALQRHRELQALGIGTLDLTGLPPARIKLLARTAATAWAPIIARMPTPRRLATLLAFVAVYEVTALDDALDVLDLLITDIAAQAERLGQQQRLRTVRDLDQAALALREACALLLDPQYPDQEVRAVVLKHIPEERLRQAMATIETLARPADDHYQEELVDRYQRVRRFLPAVLRQVQFQATPSGQPVLEALQFLRALEGKRHADCKAAPREGIPTRGAGWSSIKTTRCSVRPIPCAPWDACKMGCGGAISTSAPASAGAIRAPNSCRARVGRRNAARSAVP